MPEFVNMTYKQPGEYEYAPDAGGSTELWRFSKSPEDDADSWNKEVIHDKIQEILGTTGYEVYSEKPGKIDRTTPMASSFNDDQIAVGVKLIPVRDQGNIGDDMAFLKTDVDEEQFVECVRLGGNYTLWRQYDMSIRFALPKWPIVSNGSILETVFTAYDSNGDTFGGTYFPEWQRYTIEGWETREEILKAKGAKLKFRTRSGSSPNGDYYQGLVTMPLRTQVYTIDWFNVPLRYVRSSNSLLRKHQFKINQQEWNGYPAGSLLYKGFKLLDQFTQPFAGLDPSWGGTLVPAAQKLCHLRLEFLYTDRVISDAPLTVSNPNWVIGGWNALPNLRTRKYYYVSVDNTLDATKQVPSWESVFFPLLWQDPDTDQASVW